MGKSMKMWYRSKSIWTGIAAIVAGFGMYMTGEQSLAELLLGANGVLAILLRFATSQGVKV